MEFLKGKKIENVKALFDSENTENMLMLHFTFDDGSTFDVWCESNWSYELDIDEITLEFASYNK